MLGEFLAQLQSKKSFWARERGDQDHGTSGLTEKDHDHQQLQHGQEGHIQVGHLADTVSVDPTNFKCYHCFKARKLHQIGGYFKQARWR